MTQPDTTARVRTPVLLALGCLVLFCLGLGSVGLLDPDEPYYAVPAFEMMQTGSWAVPVFHGMYTFDKPVFFYWMVRAGYALFGVSEFGARAGSALAGLATVLAVYLFGRRMRFGERGALAAGVILATSLQFVVMARAAVTDMTLTFWLTLGLLATARWLADPKAWCAVLAGASFGLAALTKGPVGILLPAVALGLYAVLARRFDFVRPRAALHAVGAALAFGAPWYVYMALEHRDLLVGEFLEKGNLGRFSSPEHVQFPFFYVLVFAAGMLPWSGALPWALGRAARPSAWRSERAVGSIPGPLFALCWFVAIVGVFEITASKLASYVLPALPAASLLLAQFWDDVTQRADEPRTGRLAAMTAAAVPGILALAAAAAAVSRRLDPGLATPVAVGMGLFFAGSAAGFLSLRRRSLAAIVIPQAVGAVLALAVLLGVALPRIDPMRSTKPLLEAISDRVPVSEIAGTYELRQEFSLDFYARRTLLRAASLEELERAVAVHSGGVWILDAAKLGELQRDGALRVETVQILGPHAAARISARRVAAGTSPVNSGARPR